MIHRRLLSKAEVEYGSQDLFVSDHSLRNFNPPFLALLPPSNSALIKRDSSHKCALDRSSHTAEWNIWKCVFCRLMFSFFCPCLSPFARGRPVQPPHNQSFECRPVVYHFSLLRKQSKGKWSALWLIPFGCHAVWRNSYVDLQLVEFLFLLFVLLSRHLFIALVEVDGSPL